MANVKKLRYSVNGEWRESKTECYLDVTDSSTGEIIAKVPCCTEAEVREAIESARDAFSGWSATPVAKRVGILFRFRHLLDDNLEELTRLVAQELGKHLQEARGDVLKAIEVVELACGVPVMMQGDSLMNVSNGYDTVMYREPVGVFAGIVPFNFPAMVPFGWMIPLCIATGNTFILKANSLVPQTAMRMLEILYESGLPKGVVNLVTCNPEEAELLTTHPDVNGVSFVGSTKVGRHIYMTAASHGKRVQVLGAAKNHGLVLGDADLQAAASRIANASFGCAGQRCMALPAVCVEEEVADEFVSYFVDAARNIKVGCAYREETDLGPLVSAERKQAVLNWIDKGVEEGAELILDGRDVAVPGFEKGYFVGPTIFDHVKPGMSVGDEEIFGPVTCIKRVCGFEEGISLMNASQYANGSCIFTNNGLYAREFARRTHAGMVGVNVGIPVPVSYFPFSGHKNSFMGDLHVLGKDGVAFYTEAKSVTSTWLGYNQKSKELGTWEGTITRI